MYQCECGCTDMIYKKEGNIIGIYCIKCDRLQKWITKDELKSLFELYNFEELNMREATIEEQKAVQDYINSISEPTGFNFWDNEDEV